MNKRKEEDKPIATTVIELLKASVKRTYLILIITIVLFVFSIIDSFYQRYKINKIVEEIYIEKR